MFNELRATTLALKRSTIYVQVDTVNHLDGTGREKTSHRGALMFRRDGERLPTRHRAVTQQHDVRIGARTLHGDRRSVWRHLGAVRIAWCGRDARRRAVERLGEDAERPGLAREIADGGPVWGERDLVGIGGRIQIALCAPGDTNTSLRRAFAVCLCSPG